MWYEAAIYALIDFELLGLTLLWVISSSNLTQSTSLPTANNSLRKLALHISSNVNVTIDVLSYFPRQIASSASRANSGDLTTDKPTATHNHRIISLQETGIPSNLHPIPALRTSTYVFHVNVNVKCPTGKSQIKRCIDTVEEINKIRIERPDSRLACQW